MKNNKDISRLLYASLGLILVYAISFKIYWPHHNNDRWAQGFWLFGISLFSICIVLVVLASYRLSQPNRPKPKLLLRVFHRHAFLLIALFTGMVIGGLEISITLPSILVGILLDAARLYLTKGLGQKPRP